MKSNEKIAYSPEEACEVAGFRKTTLYEEIKAGRLKARKLGKKTLILHTDLRSYLEDLPYMNEFTKFKQASTMVAARWGKRKRRK